MRRRDRSARADRAARGARADLRECSSTRALEQPHAFVDAAVVGEPIADGLEHVQRAGPAQRRDRRQPRPLRARSAPVRAVATCSSLVVVCASSSYGRAQPGALGDHLAQQREVLAVRRRFSKRANSACGCVGSTARITSLEILAQRELEQAQRRQLERAPATDRRAGARATLRRRALRGTAPADGGSRSSVESIVAVDRAHRTRASNSVVTRRRPRRVDRSAPPARSSLVVGLVLDDREAPRRLRRDRQRPRARLLGERRRDHAQHREHFVAGDRLEPPRQRAEPARGQPRAEHLLDLLAELGPERIERLLLAVAPDACAAARRPACSQITSSSHSTSSRRVGP